MCSSRKPKPRRSRRPAPITATTSAGARHRRARHLVLVGPLAVLDARLAERTEDLRRFYPTSVLVTDVRHHLLLGRPDDDVRHALHGKGPLRQVLIHARVVDEGQKMSKTKGNVIDPLTLIDQYGADALRFGLAIAAALGKDVRMVRPASRATATSAPSSGTPRASAEMNACDPVAGFDPASPADTINRWIVGETVKTERLVREALEAFRFNDAATALYQFVWNTYCDWYVELICRR